MICRICHRNDTYRYSCNTCTEATRRRLREIELYAQWLALPTMLEPTRGTTGRRSPGYSSRPPARDDALVMLDHRSRTDQAGPDDEPEPLWSLLGTLHGLAQAVRAHLDQTAPRQITLSGEVGYLLGRLDWAAGQPWIGDIAEDVRELHAQARTLAGDQPPRPLGTCQATGCGGTVYEATLHQREARCKRCERPYTGLDLVRLATQEAR